MNPDLNILRKNYFYFSTINTRWIDNDLYGHINNVVYYQFFDTVANLFLIERCGLDIHEGSTIAFIVSSSCNYLKPIAHPATINAGFRVNRLGTSSVEYGIGIFQGEEPDVSACGTFTHVFVDRNSGKSVPIPDNYRSEFSVVMLGSGE